MPPQAAASNGQPPQRRPALHLPGEEPSPGDWSELGRRVLAEALRRARDELARRGTRSASPVGDRSLPEQWS